MASIPGVTVTGMIVPTDTADTYAVADAKYIKGVNYAVPTKQDLLAITDARKTEGMEVFVVEEKKKYQWLENDWKEITAGGAGGGANVDLSNYVDLTKLEEKLNEKLADYIPRTELTELDIYTKQEVDNLVGAAGGDFSYTNATPVTGDIGGISAGTTFNNTPLKEILDNLFYPYLKPAFTSFSLNNKVVEVGTAVTTNNYSWAISNVANAKLDTLTLTLDGQQLTIGNKVGNGNNVAIANTSITKNTAASVTATISANNSKDEAFSANATISWKYKMYTGVSTKDTLTADEIKAMTSKLADNAKGVHNYTGSGYQYLVFPAAWGMPATIKDNKTGFGLSYSKLSNVSIQNNGVTTDYIVIRSNEYLNNVVPLIVS